MSFYKNSSEQKFLKSVERVEEQRKSLERTVSMMKKNPNLLGMTQ